MSKDLHINALLTEVGVSMGDHGQDVTKAIILTPEMTVRDLCEKHLTKRNWASLAGEASREADGGKYLTIRLAVEATE